MDLFLLGVSFLSGVLTILAPCVLPLLPVIVGGAAGSQNRWQPVIMSLSLVVSVVLFTLLLKYSTQLINVPQEFWTGVSGGIILVFGVFTLFPKIWEWISVKFNLIGRSQKGLLKAKKTESRFGGVFVGAALGPVFSSCSPTYFVILATVLPVSFLNGFVYLIAYGLGLGLMLGLIAFFGQRLTMRLGWAADPSGWFKRVLGILLILVGIGILTGVDKDIESYLVGQGLGVTQLEERLLDDLDERMNEDDSESTDLLSQLPILGVAPELSGLENWINSDPILSMDDLRGKVVLVDFWTYSCINCIRTLPYLQAWHERYEDDGLVILGVHAPEFQFERKVENVQEAVDEFGLTYPVVQDNEFSLWRAYENRYWPAKYLIDQEGNIRYEHFGEGEYDETEAAIVELLGASKKTGVIEADEVDHRQIGTRETYIGLKRRKNFVEDAGQTLSQNEWTLVGDWVADDEKAVAQEAGTAIRMNFSAAKANLVMSGPALAEVWIDGELANESNAGADVVEGKVMLDKERLYELADFKGVYGEEHEIEVRFLDPGAALFAWTFG